MIRNLSFCRSRLCKILVRVTKRIRRPSERDWHRVRTPSDCGHRNTDVPPSRRYHSERRPLRFVQWWSCDFPLKSPIHLCDFLRDAQNIWSKGPTGSSAKSWTKYTILPIPITISYRLGRTKRKNNF